MRSPGDRFRGGPGPGVAAHRAPPVRGRKGRQGGASGLCHPGAELSPAAGSSLPGGAKVKGLRWTTGPGTPIPRTRHPPRGQGKPRPVDLGEFQSPQRRFRVPFGSGAAAPRAGAPSPSSATQRPTWECFPEEHCLCVFTTRR